MCLVDKLTRVRGIDDDSGSHHLFLFSANIERNNDYKSRLIKLGSNMSMMIGLREQFLDVP